MEAIPIRFKVNIRALTSSVGTLKLSKMPGGRYSAFGTPHKVMADGFKSRSTKKRSIQNEENDRIYVNDGMKRGENDNARVMKL